MERRDNRRYPRRLEVRFVLRGEGKPHSAFTTNISTTGMFLATVHPLERGDRMRIEVLDQERGFAVEGVVARVHRVSPALRQVSQPGAGVRFMNVSELISELFLGVTGSRGPVAGPEPGPIAADDEIPGPDPPQVTESRGPSSPSGSWPAPPSSGAYTMGARPASDSGARPAPPPALAKPAQPISFTTPPMVGALVFSLRLHNPQELLRIHDRDVRSGGLFIRTPNPAPVDARITVEVHLPAPANGPLFFGARVVHCFNPPAPSGTGANLLAGMGVVFDEPEAVLAALKPHVDRIRGE